MTADNDFLSADDQATPGSPGARRYPAGADLKSLAPPNLLVHWEPRWRGFCSAIGPALRASEPPLEGECRAGAIHGRNSVLSALLHLTALLVVISIPMHFVRSQQLLRTDETRQYQVIYYSGNELPQMMHDAGGAQAGETGRSGGRELYHPTQVIRIVRGHGLVDVVADAPMLKLPRSNGPVANLLTASASDPGPPPAASVHSAMSAAARAFQSAPVAAPPEIRRDSLASPPDLTAAMVNAPPDTHLQVAGLRIPELGAAHVVPPPVSAPARATESLPKLTLPMSIAVAPPPIVAREVSSVGIPGFGAKQDLIPPPPQAGGGGSANGSTAGSAARGTLNAAGSLMGAGTGSANGGATAVVVSANPGVTVGMPANGGFGTLAMSPHGGGQPGSGGSGGGTGSGHGNGPGSGSHGGGPGSSTAGVGPGSGAVRPGTSPYPGPGGTGRGNGTAGIPGVTVIGGTVTIPGFSTPSNSAGGMSRSPNDARSRPAITIIATARSGGALNTYGVFKGSKVYTIYIDTRIGVAVLQYAERSASARGFEDDLTPPGPLNSDLPADIKRSHLLISCLLDTSGMLKNLRVVESDPAAERDKITTALEHWRFRPVLRNNQPVEVDVMLGFNVDTR